jgi:quercetin dioxygenase-like cupin family protein
MNVKYNEATVNRPDGDRVIDAPYVISDLAHYSNILKEETAWEKNDRNGITLFKSDHLTVVFTALHPDAEIKDSEAKGALTIQVIEGKIKVEIGNEQFDISAGQVINLHHDTEHSIKAIDESMILISCAF